MKNFLVLGTVVVVTTLCPGQLRAAVRLPAVDAYAEDLYAEYAAATGHRVRFEVEVLTEGTLEEIDGKPFGGLLSVPRHRVRGSLFGTQIRNPRFVTPAQDPVKLRDLEYTVKQFDDLDYPIGFGAYRKLRIGVTLDGESKGHEALELCWPAVKRCVVVDPVVVHVQSVVDTRLRLSAEGWGAKVEIHRPEKPSGPEPSGACRLAGHPQWDSVLYRWDAWSMDYKDALGAVILHKEMGAQEAGIRCAGTSRETCRPTPLGGSLPASCRVEDSSYTCACGNAFSFTALGSSARATSEARCSHSATQQAAAKVDGDLRWELAGEVDGNGGEVLDTCVWTVDL